MEIVCADTVPRNVSRSIVPLLPEIVMSGIATPPSKVIAPTCTLVSMDPTAVSKLNWRIVTQRFRLLIAIAVDSVVSFAPKIEMASEISS